VKKFAEKCWGSNRLQILLLGLTFLVLISCPKTNHEDRLNLISIAVATTPESLDPRYAGSVVAQRMAKLLYAPLVEYGDDLLPKPYLAKKFEQIDSLTYRVYLRENLKFHNGDKLESKDVVYTYSELDSDDVRSPKSERIKLENIKYIKALSNTLIEFKLKQPFSSFIDELIGIGIVSKKQCLGRSQKCRHELVGSGPYKIKSINSATGFLKPTHIGMRVNQK